jgi:arylformamidase
MHDRPVFLHYTQAELDRNFDQRGWVKNALELIGRCEARSRATRSRLAYRSNVPYGPTEDEVVDIFPAECSPAPVQIFVHGGAWRNFTKDDYSFPADVYVPAGVHTVIVNFANLPTIRLPQMVVQVRRAIDWTYENATSFGGDPARIFLSAQSSGAHLCAMALATPSSRDVPRAAIKGATLVSGPYDLEPVVLSARGAYVKLSPAEVRELSPIRHTARMPCPVIVVYAEHDTDEFQRQSSAFAEALNRVGRLGRVVRVPGVNHFELMEHFGDPKSLLANVVLEQMRTAHVG